MFLLVLENMPKGTSKQSVLHLVHQRLAQLFKLSSFSLIKKRSSGRDKPSSRSARRNSARIVHISPGFLERDPKVRSHILMVLSLEQLTRMLGLSGLKATHVTQLLLKYTKLVLKIR